MSSLVPTGNQLTLQYWAPGGVLRTNKQVTDVVYHIGMDILEIKDTTVRITL